MGSWFCFPESVVDNAGLKVVRRKLKELTMTLEALAYIYHQRLS